MISRAKLSLTVLLVGIAGLGFSCASATDVKTSITQPDIRRIPDGTYEGRYFLFPVNVKVKTTIASGRIERIELVRHFNGKGTAAEAIVPMVLERQSIEVDVISGATHSSVTILKAIEDSLNKGTPR